MFRTFMLAMICAAGNAQPPGNQPNIKSTEVLPDHRVMFRILRPKPVR
jgi:hypothetical protein